MRAPIEYLDCFCMVLQGKGQILPVLGTVAVPLRALALMVL
jgi:hypothetical protein